MLYDKWNCQHDSECVQVRPNKSVLCVLLQFYVLRAELACCQYWQLPPHSVFLHIVVHRTDCEVVHVITFLLLFRGGFSQSCTIYCSVWTESRIINMVFLDVTP